MTVENSTEQLVERIRRDAKVPKGSTYYDAATLLGIADTETRSLVVQLVAASSGDYPVRYVDVPLVPGKRAYRLPSRAIREKDVERYDASGNPLPFALIDSSQAKDNRGSGRHYYFEGGSFVPVLESGATGGFFRVRYYRFPGRLVLPSACARFLGVDEFTPDTYTLSVSDSGVLGVPGSFVAVDFVRATAPFEPCAESMRIGLDAMAEPFVSGSPSDLPADFNLATDLDVGDYLCPEGTSCFPQLPLVFHDVLVGYVVARIRREMNDFDGEAAAKASADEKAGKAVAVSSPRSKQGTTVSGSPWMR